MLCRCSQETVHHSNGWLTRIYRLPSHLPDYSHLTLRSIEVAAVAPLKPGSGASADAAVTTATDASLGYVGQSQCTSALFVACLCPHDSYFAVVNTPHKNSQLRYACLTASLIRFCLMHLASIPNLLAVTPACLGVMTSRYGEACVLACVLIRLDHGLCTTV